MSTDFIDIINNQSAPKSCYISFSATKSRRSDVMLQYHKAEAIIEHMGDVSSLEGKVQRIHEDYFKKHNLLSTLFDNPAADVYALDGGATPQLQSVYGAHGNSANLGGAPAVTIAAHSLDKPKAVLEVVFKEPISASRLE
ncbi:unnamed protein product [Effrenium voratum]|nr:unnamed protein product [Effrenium voratum]